MSSVKPEHADIAADAALMGRLLTRSELLKRIDAQLKAVIDKIRYSSKDCPVAQC